MHGSVEEEEDSSIDEFEEDYEDTEDEFRENEEVDSCHDNSE